MIHHMKALQRIVGLGIIVILNCSIVYREQIAGTDFTPESAKVIWNIESLIEQYEKTGDNDRQAAVAEITELYCLYRGSFPAIVALNGLLDVDKLDAVNAIIRSEGQQDLFITFAQKMQQGAERANSFKQGINNPQLQGFLSSWQAFRGENGGTTPFLQVLRKETRIRTMFSDFPKEQRIGRLVDFIKAWESPLEAMDALLLMNELFDANVHHEADVIVEQLKRLLMSSIPETVSPPNQVQHAVFYGACLLAKSLGDARLIESLTVLGSSDNRYVSQHAAEALIWLHSQIRYPLKYRMLFGAYSTNG